eukprot:TRINITY_DN1158_c5_g1_i3.p1 TRINITY_DN1158_c5_g1~~TRINITY_DN1158_c5_g1_i3.p1  ORF type:complete len:1011 (+),score=196.48 TRINITY_DN1158_c5_g1_i3:393-3035(+)
MVTKKQFELYLRRFGPPEKSLTKTRELLQNGSVWFHGKQGRLASERLLTENLEEGSFLLRYSSLEGAFTVDYIKGGKIHHFNNIKNDPSGGVCVFVGKSPEQHKAYKFTSMSAFISKNAHIFVNPCHNPRSHFQWLKLRIPKPDDDDAGSGVNKTRSGDEEVENEHDMRIPVEERVKNAIQNAFKRKKNTLSLRGIGLGPTLPLHVCNLSYVVYLDLGNNQLTELPQELQALRSLRTLNVSSNKLRTLPTGIFAHLPRLSFLLASENELQSIPETVYHGSQVLAYIDFSQNMLTSLSAGIGGVANLGFLNLNSNMIAELPNTISKLDKLEELKLSKNRLRALPPTLASLPSLVLLDVSENNIATLPKSLLDVVVENPRFMLSVQGNPLSREDEEILRRAKDRSNRPEEKESRSILDGIQISDEKQPGQWQGGRDEDESASSRKIPLHLSSADLRTEGSSHSSLWLPSFGYFVEAGQGPKKMNELQLQEHINCTDYHKYFLGSVHANIIGNDKLLGAICISIQKSPETVEAGKTAGAILSSLITSRPSDSLEGVYRVLMRTKVGDRRLDISTNDVKVKKGAMYARTDELLNALKRMLKPTFDPKNLYVIRNQDSHKVFAELENKLTSNCSKIGLLYAKDGQSETEMYNNFSGSKEFEEFLDLMGDKIDMMGWTKFRGDFNNKTTQKSVYTLFNDHEIMFHVSTYLPWQDTTDEYGQQILRKRYIGNDIVVIIYYEGTKPVDPSTFVSNFNHVFAIVQPVNVGGQDCYRVHMTYKVGVADSKPRLPEDPTFTKAEIKQFLLTKLVNAERCAMSATQFRRPQEMVRHELFKDLQVKFPKSRMSSSSGSSKKSPDEQSGYLYVTPEMSAKLKKDSGRLPVSSST